MHVAHRVRQAVGVCLMVGSLLAVAVLGAAAEESQPTRSESVSLRGASSASVDVELGAGRLLVASGSLASAGTPIPAGDLLRGDFFYDDDRLGPTLDYRVDGAEGTLSLEQEGGDLHDWPWEEHRSDWNLFLNPEVPTALHVEVGVGETTLALGGLSLTRLDVETGAGDTALDLSGDWRSSLDVRVEGGAGDLTVRVPEHVGVRVEAELGAGDLETDGLSRDGDAYVNDAYGESEITLTIEIEHGAGDVELETVG